MQRLIISFAILILSWIGIYFSELPMNIRYLMTDEYNNTLTYPCYLTEKCYENTVIDIGQNNSYTYYKKYFCDTIININNNEYYYPIDDISYMRLITKTNLRCCFQNNTPSLTVTKGSIEHYVLSNLLLLLLLYFIIALYTCVM